MNTSVGKQTLTYTFKIHFLKKFVKYILITGSAGLIGSECSEFFVKKGFKVLGLDNDSRKKFFGTSGSTNTRRRQLNQMKDYQHFNVDIRNKKKV